MNPFDCPMVSRRGFLARTGLGLGGLLLGGGAGQAGETSPLIARAPHFAPKA